MKSEAAVVVEFREGEVVWARTASYPWWPAQVMTIKQGRKGEKTYKARFLAYKMSSNFTQERVRRFANYFQGFVRNALGEKLHRFEMLQSLWAAKMVLIKQGLDVSYFQPVDNDITALNLMSPREIKLQRKKEQILEKFMKKRTSKRETKKLKKIQKIGEMEESEETQSIQPVEQNEQMEEKKEITANQINGMGNMEQMENLEKKKNMEEMEIMDLVGKMEEMELVEKRKIANKGKGMVEMVEKKELKGMVGMMGLVEKVKAEKVEMIRINGQLREERSFLTSQKLAKLIKMAENLEREEKMKQYRGQQPIYYPGLYTYNPIYAQFTPLLRPSHGNPNVWPASRQPFSEKMNMGLKGLPHLESERNEYESNTSRFDGNVCYKNSGIKRESQNNRNKKDAKLSKKQSKCLKYSTSEQRDINGLAPASKKEASYTPLGNNKNSSASGNYREFAPNLPSFELEIYIPQPEPMNLSLQYSLSLENKENMPAILHKILQILLTIDAKASMTGLQVPFQLMTDMVLICLNGLECVHLPVINMGLIKKETFKEFMSKFFKPNFVLYPEWDSKARSPKGEEKGSTVLAERVKQWILRIYTVEMDMRLEVGVEMGEEYEDSQLQTIAEVAKEYNRVLKARL